LKEDGANIVPMVNQIEGSVTLQNPNIVRYCLITISFPAFSPLGRGLSKCQNWSTNWRNTAKTPDKSRSLPLQLGYAVTYLTNFEKRMVSNAQVFDFELSDDEMSQLTALNRPTVAGVCRILTI
jgi:diketogulonate reductase-like aldo/keto reductase